MSPDKDGTEFRNSLDFRRGEQEEADKLSATSKNHPPPKKNPENSLGSVPKLDHLFLYALDI
jgi:hypothetical protein